MTVRVEEGNCLEVMRRLAEEGVRVDAIVTDPPYHLTQASRNGSPRYNDPETPFGRTRLGDRGFMGKAWDGGDVAFNSVTWGLAGELLKPGGYLLAFGGTRTYHKLGWAIEGGGLEILDAVLWHYGSGFPKNHNPMLAMRSLPRSLTRAEWKAWHRLVRQRSGTALKPATEIICLARRPLSEGTIAANLLKHGTGALNVDGCRVNPGERVPGGGNGQAHNGGRFGAHETSGTRPLVQPHEQGRWPANVVHDGSPEVEAAFAAFGEQGGGFGKRGGKRQSEYGFGGTMQDVGFGDTGTASRFFYTAKADKHDRWGSKHPTVKPIDLMRWLVRLVTPPGGTVLDPFAGSGTTAVACLAEGFDCIMIEREEEYLADIRERLAFYAGEGRHSLAAKGRNRVKTAEDLPLFQSNT